MGNEVKPLLPKMAAQGLFEGSCYRRSPQALDPRVSWIFEGVDDDILGSFGLSGGGAAGYEPDRADRRLGTPEHTIILASSQGRSGGFVLVPEEHLTHVTAWLRHELRALGLPVICIDARHAEAAFFGSTPAYPAFLPTSVVQSPSGSQPSTSRARAMSMRLAWGSFA